MGFSSFATSSAAHFSLTIRPWTMTQGTTSASPTGTMYLCPQCQSYLRVDEDAGPEQETPSCCHICLGFFDSPAFQSRLQDELKKALAPYGDLKDNPISQIHSEPSISLPGDILLQYRAWKTDKSLPDADFVNELKKAGRHRLDECLDHPGSPEATELPACIRDEEQGYLCVHVLVVPKDSVVRPRLAGLGKASKQRTRWKGPAEEVSQGGDPRMNLLYRVQEQSTTTTASFCTLNQALALSVHSSELSVLKQSSLSPGDALDVHVAVWRRPFYLKGCYTKGRRDVSQTPFYVVDAGKRRRLGATSVEEQILPAVMQQCGGISNRNNNPQTPLVHFGMAKFHASGREDMDVRMLLPLPEHVGEGTTITGRPFCCAVFDALRMPTKDSLKRMIHDINGSPTNGSDAMESARTYGFNLMGVGISSDFSFAPTSAYSNLQAETESKVKHYGCLCWSERILPGSNLDLNQLLGAFPLEIQQRTPVRVLHRRSNQVRIRHVLSLKAHRIDDYYFRLHLSTDAGTYVKEFVHGDLARTTPSISTLLGCKTDILELDCEGIET